MRDRFLQMWGFVQFLKVFNKVCKYYRRGILGVYTRLFLNYFPKILWIPSF